MTWISVSLLAYCAAAWVVIAESSTARCYSVQTWIKMAQGDTKLVDEVGKHSGGFRSTVNFSEAKTPADLNNQRVVVENHRETRLPWVKGYHLQTCLPHGRRHVPHLELAEIGSFQRQERGLSHPTHFHRLLGRT
jgi:hypothetical protein